jgi:hypothetical protein
MPLSLANPVVLGMIAIAGVAFVVGSWKAGEAWRSTALRHPDRGGDSGSSQRFRFATVTLRLDGHRPLTYRNCVNVSLSDAGIRLTVWGPFGLGHPALLIGWDVVMTSESTFTPMGDAARLVLDNGAELMVYGAPGKAVLRSFSDLAV